MTTFNYTPDAEQKVHAPGAISLLCKPFQSHENGLPEWAKNAADAYGREGLGPDCRVVVLLFCDLKSQGAPSIACLDFVGTTAEKIETYFRHWADPDAAAQDTGFCVQGGHGNGGKCYMTQMFTEYSILHTVRDGKGCRYGVAGGTIKFGYVPNRERGRDYAVPDLAKELDAALHGLGATVADLPARARRAFESASGFTLVRGVGPKNYEGKIKVVDLISQVRDHPQMLTTLEFCDVYVLHNGKPLKEACPLRPSVVEPLPGAETPRVIDIPKTLVDPLTKSKVSTTSGDTLPAGRLYLMTSKTSMRWSKKSRHTINYKAGGGFIGYRSMLEFPVQSAFRDRIYGECELESLEAFKQNHRGPLAESPLTRAVEDFITHQIEEYAEFFESQEKQKYTKRERNALSQMNAALDRWKNQFIRNFVEGAFGFGGGDGGIPLPVGKPARMELIVSHPRLGIGVAIRPVLRFFDKNGRQIRPVAYGWVSEDNNVAMADEDLMLINSFAPGQTFIYAETLDGTLKSNHVPIEVVRLRSIRIEPLTLEIAAGSRSPLEAVCTLASGEKASDVALIWTENNSAIVRVSANGVVFGASPGEAEVFAGDDKVMCEQGAKIRVVEGAGLAGREGKGTGKSSGRQRGRGYPLILVSGVDPDPDTGDFRHFTSDHPPVWQEPVDADRNIWWINSAAPLARMYLDKDLGYGYESREWRMYHLERYVDIITQIAMTYDPRISGPMTVNQWILSSGEKIAEIQSAVAAELADFIRDGRLP